MSGCDKTNFKGRLKLGHLLNFKNGQAPVKMDQFQGSMDTGWNSFWILKRLGRPWKQTNFLNFKSKVFGWVDNPASRIYNWRRYNHVKTRGEVHVACPFMFFQCLMMFLNLFGIIYIFNIYIDWWMEMLFWLKLMRCLKGVYVFVFDKVISFGICQR
jgi:hypothetical protein